MDTHTPSRARSRPCASCPYRLDVPSSVWAPEEYQKLRTYDGPTWEQSPATFGCHSNGGESLCSGWLACHNPQELLAVRLGVMTGSVDPSVCDYTTTVAVFGSGAEAADHGQREIEQPGPDAVAVIEKIVTSRVATGRFVDTDAGSVTP